MLPLEGEEEKLMYTWYKRNNIVQRGEEVYVYVVQEKRHGTERSCENSLMETKVSLVGERVGRSIGKVAGI